MLREGGATEPVAGTRPVPPLCRDVGRLGCVRPEGPRLLRHRESARGRPAVCAGCSDQLRGLPPPALARFVQREPGLDLRAADQAIAVALLLARLHEHHRQFPGRAREPHRRGRNRASAGTTVRWRRCTTRTRATSPTNAPLVVSQPGSTVHDATFWQPLALGKKAAHGLAAVPAEVQSFEAASGATSAGSRSRRRGRACRSIPELRRSACRRAPRTGGRQSR